MPACYKYNVYQLGTRESGVVAVYKLVVPVEYFASGVVVRTVLEYWDIVGLESDRDACDATRDLYSYHM